MSVDCCLIVRTHPFFQDCSLVVLLSRMPVKKKKSFLHSGIVLYYFYISLTATLEKSDYCYKHLCF